MSLILLNLNSTGQSVNKLEGCLKKVPFGGFEDNQTFLPRNSLRSILVTILAYMYLCILVLMKQYRLFCVYGVESFVQKIQQQKSLRLFTKNKMKKVLA